MSHHASTAASGAGDDPADNAHIHSLHVFLTHARRGLKPVRERGRKRDRRNAHSGQITAHPLLAAAMQPGMPAAFIHNVDVCAFYSKLVPPLLIVLLNGLITFVLISAAAPSVRGQHALVQAVLAAVLFCTGNSLLVTAQLTGSNIETVRHRKNKFLPFLEEYLMPFIPWGVKDAHRRAAEQWHQGILPGFVGFVDGVTWPTTASSDTATRRRWYSVHHRCSGYNYLIFSDVAGNVIWVEPMGPGSGMAEVTAAKLAVRKMRAMGVLGEQEFFIGDGVFRGVHPHVRPLAGPAYQKKLAQRAQEVHEKDPQLAAALACVVTQRALERELTVSGRQTVENVMVQLKFIGGVSGADASDGRFRLHAKPGVGVSADEEEQVKRVGLIAAGLLAFTQVHGLRVPRSSLQLSLRQLWQPAYVP